MSARKLTDEQAAAVLKAAAAGMGYGRIRDEIIKRWGVERAPSMANIRNLVKGRTYKHSSKVCKYGHEWTEANTIISKTTGKRRCRTCRDKENKARRKT